MSVNSPVAAAFVRWAFVRAALARGWWLATSLYLVVVADLSPAQLVLIGVFQGLTVVVAEVPAGVVADAVSRRGALVAAHVVMGAGMALTGMVTGYGWIVVSQCLWGLGWAISSGADVAWVTDELDRPDLIDRVLVAQGRYDLAGAVTGIAVFGGFVWATSLAIAIVGAGVGMIALGVVVVARWPEQGFTPSRRAGSGRSAATAILRRGVTIARGDRVVVAVLVATLLVNGGAEGYGRLLQVRFLALGIPARAAPIVFFAVIAVLSAGLGAVVLRIVEARIDGRSAPRWTYVSACAVGTVGMIAFACAPNAQCAVVGSLLVAGIGLPVSRIAATVIVNRRTTSDARATVHSLLSQAENLGEIVCGSALAVVAGSTSTTVTLLAAAALVAAAGLVMIPARDQPTADASTREPGATPA